MSSGALILIFTILFLAKQSFFGPQKIFSRVCLSCFGISFAGAFLSSQDGDIFWMTCVVFNFVGFLVSILMCLVYLNWLMDQRGPK